jgi:hypothetical protein
MSSQEVSDKNSLPDLIVNECLFGCEGCPGICTNRQIGHRILCRCVCGHGRIKNNQHKNICLQGPKVSTSQQAQAVEVIASKPATTTTDATPVKAELMKSADSKGRSDHRHGDAGG